MNEHWSTRHLADDEVRLRYQRLMSRALNESLDELLEELRLRLEEAHDQGWLDDPGDDRRAKGAPDDALHARTT